MRFVYGEPVAFEDAQESTADKCEQWLLDYLAEHGPSKPNDILIAGKIQVSPGTRSTARARHCKR